MRTHNKWRWIIILPVLVLILAACGGDDNGNGNGNGGDTTNPSPNAPLSTAPAVGGVVMVNTTFQPQQIEVAVGTTVTWTNQDTTAHTVTAGPRDNPSGLFDSGEIAAGGTFSFTFTEAGTFPYHCSPHQGMDGTVIVTAPEG